ncbi:MAG: sulfatase-like hydrolase/transferase [Acidobacteriota bacterium]|nr:sulfatase-like hydrolase/transferase [Acidobacteriota bacterium]
MAKNKKPSNLRAAALPRRTGLQSRAPWPKDVPPPARKTRLARIWPVFVVAALAAAAGSYWVLRPKPVKPAPFPRDARLNVVLITLDTTRADRLGCYGYAGAATPNLDALARKGARFARAYAQVPLTLPSHASIMTGRNPYAHGVHNNGTYVLPRETPTLARTLKSKGYRTAAFTASFSVDSRFGLDQGFDVYDDDIQPDSPFKSVNGERRAEQVLQVFEPWFEKAAAGTDPFFVWVHFFDPHLPYNPPSPIREEFTGNLYDGEVAYMDLIIGQVMLRLKAKNLLERTLVVVAGDHGESFGEKGEYGHGVFLYEPAVHVPLLMYAEGRIPAGTVVPSRVRLIDILPTVLDVLDTPVPEKVQGLSLIPYILGRKKDDLDVYLESFYPRENFGWAALTGFVSGPWKYIEAPKRELYNLPEDPGEKANLAGRDKTADDLKAKLRAALSRETASSRRTPSESDKARLRSLGYVDYSDPAGKAGAADPKDKLEELRMVQDAEKAEYEGRIADAAVLYAKMAGLRPDAASSYVGLALAQARLKDFPAAVATLRRGLDRLPDSELLMTRLGYTYLVMNKADEASAAMRNVLKINPASLEALTGLAMISEGRNRRDEARGYFEKALAVEPENRTIRLGYAGNLAASGRPAEAVIVYESLIRDYPKDAEVQRTVGAAYARAGDFDKAIAAFRQSIVLEPAPDAYYSLGFCFREKGDTAEAIASFEKFLADPGNEPAAKVQSARAVLARLKASAR